MDESFLLQQTKRLLLKGLFLPRTQTTHVHKQDRIGGHLGSSQT